jgi:hypothetical protein
MTERWKQCSDFPDYEVSSHGRVRRRAFVRGKAPVVLAHWNGGGEARYPKVAVRKDGQTFKVYVHRLVATAFLGLTADKQVDHRNHDTSDLTQIRIASRTENARNSRGWQIRSSRFKGVSWNKARGKWYACITLDGHSQSLGHFDHEEDAAKAYDAAAFAAWGEFAFLNLGKQRAT